MSGKETAPGALLDGRYVLVRRLGAGGAATVWLAEDLRDRREVAIKLLHPQGRSHALLRQRFLREADLLAGLEHPHLAQLLDYSVDTAMPYLVLELCRGITLEHDLGERARVGRHYETGLLLELFRQLTEAVAHAHGRGVVHRDLKPGNIMLEGAGERPTLKVLDFGVAKLLDTNLEGTTQGRILGSLGYLSPEQARGETVDGRADIFSLGCLLFEMLTLRRAWGRTDAGRPLRAYADPMRLNDYNAPLALLDRVVREARPVPSDYRSELDGRYDGLIARALAVDPAQRPATAAAFYQELLATVSQAETRTGVEAADATLALTPRRDTVTVPVQVSVRSIEARPRALLFPVLVATAVLLAAIVLLRSGSRGPDPIPPPPAEAPSAPPPSIAVAPRPVDLAAEAAAGEGSAQGTDRPAPPEPAAAGEGAAPARARVTPPVRPRAKEKGPLEVITPPAPPEPSPVEAELAALERELAALPDPAPPSALRAIAARIASVAERHLAPPTRARVRRVAQAGAALGERGALESALRETRQALLAQR